MNHPLTFHANGKILLTGEYLVLKGAEALALPLNAGQTMKVDASDRPGVLAWSALDTEGRWFDGEFRCSDLGVISSSDAAVADRLAVVLLAARFLNADFIDADLGYRVQTKLEFNREWGFGSSSTLTALIAQWAEVDPLKLHGLISEGSGYDVVCANENQPVIFRLKDHFSQVEAAGFNPPFLDEIRIIYLGRKQKSDVEVENFRKKHHKGYPGEISRVSRLTRQIAETGNRTQFMSLLAEHESVIAGVLQKEPVKSRLFPDFKGVVKSLGAWGGDFVLAISDSGSAYTEDYFTKRSYPLILPLAALLKLPDNKELIIHSSLKV